MSAAEPPFRAEHIGSLLRPASLLALRRAVARGEADPRRLAAAEDAAIQDTVALQERLGFKLATDGEFRRASYHSFFFSGLGDIEPDYVPPQAMQSAATPTRGVQPVARIGSRVRWTKPIHVADYEFLRARTPAEPKITMPGPCALHFRGGDAAVLASAYRDLDQFWDDVVEAFAAELNALKAAGCRYVQIDETAFAKFGDEEVRERLAARGDDWSELIDRYVEVTNRVLARVDGMRIGMHLCRGNRAGVFHSEGTYDAVAERLFNSLAIDFFFLEYDSARAGSFAPLRMVPGSKQVVLGLVSTKSGAMETVDALKARVDEAAKFMPLDALALSPQCGFASVDIGNPLSPQQEEAKLRLVVDAARAIWGEA